jgi:hypothetical protein
MGKIARFRRLTWRWGRNLPDVRDLENSQRPKEAQVGP